MNDRHLGGKPVIWPWFVGGMFALSICLNVALVVIASRDRSELVRRDYYAAGISYQDEIDRRNSLRTDWVLTVDESGLQRGAALLRICGVDDAGAPLGGGELTAFLTRPDDADADKELRLAPGAQPGCYEAAVRLEHQGVWALRAELRKDGSGAGLEQRLWVAER